MQERNVKHQQFLKHQMSLKERRKEREREAAVVEATLAKLAMEDDERVVNEYTDNLTRELTMRGRTIAPIHTMLHKPKGVEQWGTTKGGRG